jgi:hypothetical protein
MMDLEFLITVMDPAKARIIIKKHLGPYEADEFSSLVDEIRRKASRGKL